MSSRMHGCIFLGPTDGQERNTKTIWSLLYSEFTFYSVLASKILHFITFSALAHRDYLHLFFGFCGRFQTWFHKQQNVIEQRSTRRWKTDGPHFSMKKFFTPSKVFYPSLLPSVNKMNVFYHDFWKKINFSTMTKKKG